MGFYVFFYLGCIYGLSISYALLNHLAGRFGGRCDHDIYGVGLLLLQ